MSDESNVAVLLISHGSSLPYGEEVFNEICEKFKSLSELDAEVGYMKVSHPTLKEAVSNLKECNPGLKRIIAIPVFLANGIHTNIDIPTILGLNPKEVDPRQPDGNYPKGHYLYGLEDIDFDGDLELLDAIGPNPKLLKIINNRISSGLKESKLDDDSKTGVLLVSHGSRLNYNYEFISNLFNQFKEQTEYPCDFGFMELVEPNIPSSINNLTKNNDIDRLIVVPIFIAPGVHTTRDIPTILSLIDGDESEHHHHHHHDGEGHSHSHSHSHSHGHGDEKVEFDGEILYPDPIGSDDILIEILWDKGKEVL